ncbi:unnamed protein product [Peniophora sp. CBMAI 1063]|nr:unnamed protein product [Peniophora sp. CBMAI 1063]
MSSSPAASIPPSASPPPAESEEPSSMSARLETATAADSAAHVEPALKDAQTIAPAPDVIVKQPSPTPDSTPGPGFGPRSPPPPTSGILHPIQSAHRRTLTTSRSSLGGGQTSHVSAVLITSAPDTIANPCGAKRAPALESAMNGVFGLSIIGVLIWGNSRDALTFLYTVYEVYEFHHEDPVATMLPRSLDLGHVRIRASRELSL